MKVVRTIILCLCIATFALCVNDPAFVPDTPEPEVTDEPSGEGGESGGEVAADKNYTLSGENSSATGLEGLSSICLNEKRDGFYIAQDRGLLYEAGLDGTVKGTVPFKSSHDWEGVTVNPDDGTIYLCEEREWAIYKVNTVDAFCARGFKKSPIQRLDICWLVTANVVQTCVAESASMPVTAVSKIGLYPAAVCPDSVHGISVIAHSRIF